MQNTATIYHRDGREQTVDVHTASRLAGAGKDWSFTAPPPPGWEREVPKYRVTQDTRPAPKARFRFETPFASSSESDIWQYGDRMLKAGEIIETREWPNAGTFWPLNYSAEKVLEFFRTRQKSRLPRSPWVGDGIRLSDGLGGPGPVPKAVRPEPVRLQPRQAWPGM